MHDMRVLQEKFAGALLGTAVGDVLGAPFEGARPDDRRAVEELQLTAASRYTDDTHMTIGMAQSLVEQGGFDGAHMATTFTHNFAAEPWRGYGSGPPQIFAMLAQGVPWDQAGRTLFGGHGSWGNGAAMRVAPAALFAFRDLSQVAWLAQQTGQITHTHPLGIAGAVLQATALALLVRHLPDTPLDIPAFLADLRAAVHDPVYHEKLTRIADLLPDSPAPEVIRTLGNGIAAVDSVPTAIYAFLRSPDSFAQVIAYAVSLGGDADTIAAMAGALSGAYLGASAIPAHWREPVEGSARLRELADLLLVLALKRDTPHRIAKQMGDEYHQENQGSV